MSPMNEKVTLNRKEQKRLKVLNEVTVGHMTGQQAAEICLTCRFGMFDEWWLAIDSMEQRCSNSAHLPSTPMCISN